MKIRYRILLPTLIFFLVVGVTFAFLFRYFLVQSVKAEFQENAVVARRIIENHIQNISQEALTIAATLAAFPAIRDAYHLFDFASENPTPEEKAVYLKDTKNFLRGWMNPILKKIKKASGIKKSLKIHFHYPPANSLLRLWRPPGKGDGGDDISKFRRSVLRVNKTHQPCMGIEIGMEGIAIRGIAPIDDGKNHLGSVECFFPLERITTIFQGISTEGVAIYVLKSCLLKTSNNPLKSPAQGRFVKVLSTGSENFAEMIHPDFLEKGLKDSAFQFNLFKGIFAFPIKDITGNTIGVTVYGKDYTERLSSFRKTVFGIIGLFTIAFGILAVILIFTERSVTRPISVITRSLDQLARGTADLSYRLKATRKDEIGAMTAAFNQFMEEMDELKQFKTIIEDDETLSEVYNRLSNLLKRSFHLSAFTIYEVNNSKNHLIPIVVEGEPTGGTWCNREILTNANHCRAKRTSKEVSSFKDPQVCPMFTGGDDKTYLCIPLIIGETTGMILQLVTSREEKNLIPEIIGRLRTYLSECSPVIGAKRLVGLLKDTTTRDPLTGLLNRRYLNDSAETLTAGVLRRGTHMGILMADIDFFKQVNDTYGHEMGDEVLKRVAKILRANVRRSDVIIRYGGEEFLILLIDVKEDAVKTTGEKIRTSVESYSFPAPGGVLKKTISVGISLFPNHTENFWQCVKFSDIALYKAKETGRNRVVVFEKEMWKEEEY